MGARCAVYCCRSAGEFVPGHQQFVFNLHSMFFFPLFSAVLAALLCGYEHRSGGCCSRCLIHAPGYTPPRPLYWLCCWLWFQLAFVGAAAAAGILAGVEGSLNGRMALGSALRGWIAILPLAAIQLWFSSRWSSFGAAFGINAACILPNIVVSGLHSLIGMWFPFVLPFYAMMPQGTPFAPRVDGLSLYAWIAICCAGSLWLGGRAFRVKEFN